MEVGKKYALEKWPDSAFVDTLDRYFANEPVKQSAKKKAEITMNMDNKPMSLPGKNAKISEKKSTSAVVAPKKNEQSFPERFFDALSELAQGNREFGKKHKAKGGESLDDLLLRVYGSQIKKVPKFLSEDMLKKLNPGADFSSLSDGEMVLLPDVK
jgi:hypothetical protein